MAEIPKPPDTSSAAYSAGRHAHAAGASLSEGMEQYSNLGIVTDAADERDFTAGWDAADQAVDTEPDTGARSPAYMAGRAAFGDGLSLEDAIDAAPDSYGEPEAVEFVKGFEAAAALAKEEPSFLRRANEPDNSIGEELAAELSLKFLALADVAKKECTSEMLSAACIEHREWMRNHNVGNSIVAATTRLQAMGPSNLRVRGLVAYAALSVLDEGRANRGDVPTQDAPAGDVGGRGKGKRGKGAKANTGPKKSKRGTGWVGRIGSSVSCYRHKLGVVDSALLEMLVAGGFDREPNMVMSDPVFGWCPVDDPSASTKTWSALPSIGSDPDYVVWGLRRDAKTGCPTARFRFEAEAEATREALAQGKTNAPAARIKEITDIKVGNWYRAATPQTTLFPCTWHRPTNTLQIHTDNAAAVSEAFKLAARGLGGLDRVLGPLEHATPEDMEKIHRTDIRAADLSAPGAVDLGDDIRLWLVGRQLGGTGCLTLEGGSKLEWWLDDAVELTRDTADEKKLRVSLGGAPAEGGGLATALAEGAVLKSVRLALRVDEETWKLTLSGASGHARGWKLPVLTKPDGTPQGLDAAVDERLRLWQKGVGLLGILLTAALGDRFDRGTWRQRTAGTQREIIKGLEGVHARFIASTGQVAMFAEQVAEHVETVNAEAPKKARGGARGRTAQAEA